MIKQCTVSIFLSLTTLVWAAEPLPDKVDYNRDIKPVLSDNCYACHEPDEEQVKGGLRLDSFAAATKELKSGARAIAHQLGRLLEPPELRSPRRRRRTPGLHRSA